MMDGAVVMIQADSFFLHKKAKPRQKKAGFSLASMS
jgi:hypothetical protein